MFMLQEDIDEYSFYFMMVLSDLCQATLKSVRTFLCVLNMVIFESSI